MNFVVVVVLKMTLTPKATDSGGAWKCWFDSRGIAWPWWGKNFRSLQGRTPALSECAMFLPAFMCLPVQSLPPWIDLCASLMLCAGLTLLQPMLFVHRDRPGSLKACWVIHTAASWLGINGVQVRCCGCQTPLLRWGNCREALKSSWNQEAPLSRRLWAACYN